MEDEQIINGFDLYYPMKDEQIMNGSFYIEKEKLKCLGVEMRECIQYLGLIKYNLNSFFSSLVRA